MKAFSPVAEALSRTLAEPADKLFGLLAEIRDNLATSITLLTEIKTALTEEPEQVGPPPTKLKAVPK